MGKWVTSQESATQPALVHIFLRKIVEMEEDIGEEVDLLLKSQIATRRARGDIGVTAVTEAEADRQSQRKVVR